MKTKIINRIKALESERGIKILLACETGSRAWGFPSADSDYDVRMIYMHPKDWYLSLSPKKDHINLMLDNKMIDISAWDLRKSLNLLNRSNAALLERIQSDQTYICDPEFKADLIELADDFYAPISVMYHYLSITKKMMFELDESVDMNLKKFFYALRSSLVCKWVLENATRPPISIFHLLNGLRIPDSILGKTHELIALKQTVSESYRHQKEQELLNYIKTIIEKSSHGANSLAGAKNKSQKLNETFVRWLNSASAFPQREVS